MELGKKKFREINLFDFGLFLIFWPTKCMQFGKWTILNYFFVGSRVEFYTKAVDILKKREV